MNSHLRAKLTQKWLTEPNMLQIQQKRNRKNLHATGFYHHIIPRLTWMDLIRCGSGGTKEFKINHNHVKMSSSDTTVSKFKLR